MLPFVLNQSVCKAGRTQLLISVDYHGVKEILEHVIQSSHHTSHGYSIDTCCRRSIWFEDITDKLKLFSPSFQFSNSFLAFLFVMNKFVKVTLSNHRWEFVFTFVTHSVYFHFALQFYLNSLQRRTPFPSDIYLTSFFSDVYEKSISRQILSRGLI